MIRACSRAATLWPLLACALLAASCSKGPQPGEVLDDARIARAYGVEVVRGAHDGVPFVLPWRPVRTSGGEAA